MMINQGGRLCIPHARLYSNQYAQCKPVGKERQKTMHLFWAWLSMHQYSIQCSDRVVQVLKLAIVELEIQKWRAELIESLDTAVRESFV